MAEKLEPSEIPRCPNGHPLIPSCRSKAWHCDGAILPGICLKQTKSRQCDEVSDDIGNEGAERGAVADVDKKTKSLKLEKSKSNKRDTSEPEIHDEKAEPLLDSTKMNKSHTHIRYRCAENCNFNLCNICFQHQQESPSTLDVHTKSLIAFHRYMMIDDTNFPSVPYNENAYNRAIHLSGCTKPEDRISWMSKSLRKGGLLSLNFPFVPPEASYREAFWRQLVDQGAGYSQKKRKCPKGHFFQFDPNTDVKVWICDGEEDDDGCIRGLNSENHPQQTNVPRFACEKGCPYFVCDICIFKQRKSEEFLCPEQIISQTDEDKISIERPEDDEEDEMNTKIPKTQETDVEPQKGSQMHTDEPRCPNGHSLFPYFSSDVWCCHGAVLPGICLKQTRIKQGDENTEAITIEKGDDTSCVENADKKLTIVELEKKLSNDAKSESDFYYEETKPLLPDSTKMNENNTALHYRCTEDCNFILCNICFHHQQQKSPSTLNAEMESLITFYRRLISCKNAPLLAVKEDTYRRAILLSGSTELKDRLSLMFKFHKSKVKEKFLFIDLRESNPEVESFTDAKQWTALIATRTENYKVACHYHFKSALKKCFGKLAINLGLNFGEDLGVHHRFVVMQLCNKSRQNMFVTIEKGQYGILFQIHHKLNAAKCFHFDVENFRLEKREKVMPIGSKELTGIHRLEYKTLPLISDMLQKWEMDVVYKLWSSNCQTLTRYVIHQITDISNGVTLNLPGTNQKASFDQSEKMIEYFQDRFPKWEENRLVRVPELQVQYAIRLEQNGQQIPVKYASVADEHEEEKIYEDLKWKQFGYEGICKALDGKVFNNDKKAIFYQLDKTRSEGVVFNEQDLADIVSQFWKEVVEILIITLKLGIFIIQYGSVGGLEDDKDKMDKRVEIFRDLGEVEENCFTTINVVIQSNLVKPALKEDKRKYGMHYDISTNKNETIMFDMKNYFKDIAKKKKSVTTKTEDKLVRLIPKITVLQNLENETHLVHRSLDNQEWGKLGVMLWSESQKKCISLARQSFRKRTSLRLLVRGCQGSGKTLVLLRIAKEFVLSGKPGFFFIHVFDLYSPLIKELKDAVQRDLLLTDRVRIGQGKIGLFEKEAYLMIDNHKILFSEIGAVGLDEATDSGENSLSQEQQRVIDAVTPGKHLVICTSYNKVTESLLNQMSVTKSTGTFFQTVTLEGNLRSSPKITKLTREFQQEDDQSFERNIHVEECLSFHCPEPKIVLTDSEDRKKFEELLLKEVRRSLNDSKDVQVTLLQDCHMTTLNAIEAKLSDEEKSRVNIFYDLEALGCQFPVVILAIDATGAIYPYSSLITNAMTRATSSLTCVVNTTKKPLMIKGRPSYEFRTISQKEVLPTILALLGEVEGTIFVEGDDPIFKDIGPFKHPRVDFNWRKELNGFLDFYEKSKKSSLLLLGRESMGVLQLIAVPVIALDLDGRMCMSVYERRRKTITDFFVRKAILMS